MGTDTTDPPATGQARDEFIGGLVEPLHWRYLGQQSTAVHAVQALQADGIRAVAACGLKPSWWRPGSGWRGTGSQEEYERAAALPRCGRCVRTLLRRYGQAAIAPIISTHPTCRAAAQGSGRPDVEAVAEVYDWLALNGVSEWLPPNPVFTIRGGRLIYTSYLWAGPRGWDINGVATVTGSGGQSEPATHLQEVPLLVAPTDRVRELARAPAADRYRFELIEDPAGE